MIMKRRLFRCALSILLVLIAPAHGSSCCRWTPTGACGSNKTQRCTGLHEFLEEKTATHDFESLSCIGGNYAASFDGAIGNVTLTSAGAAAATREEEGVPFDSDWDGKEEEEDGTATVAAVAPSSVVATAPSPSDAPPPPPPPPSLASPCA